MTQKFRTELNSRSLQSEVHIYKQEFLSISKAVKFSDCKDPQRLVEAGTSRQSEFIGVPVEGRYWLLSYSNFVNHLQVTSNTLESSISCFSTSFRWIFTDNVRIISKYYCAILIIWTLTIAINTMIHFHQ